MEGANDGGAVDNEAGANEAGAGAKAGAVDNEEGAEGNEEEDSDDTEWIEEAEDLGNLFDFADTAEAIEDFDTGVEKVSEYEGSEDDVQSSETDEELEGERHRKKRVIYDPKCCHADLQIVLGMQFEDGIQCRSALTNVAIETGRFIHFRNVSKKCCLAKCTLPCPWRVLGSLQRKEGIFKIKQYAGDHTCIRQTRNKMVSSTWIAARYLNVFRVKYDMSIKELRDDILVRFKTDVYRDRLYKAKKKAQEIVKGFIEVHYGTIPMYLAELEMVDPHGRFQLIMKEGNDGNNQMFPVAWAVVEQENESCWRWFFNILCEDLEIGDGEGWSFISDQQKNVVHSIALRAEHKNCATHVYMNWKKQHKGITLKNLLWRAARCTNEADFKMAVQDLKKENQQAYDDFMARDFHRFCKAFISTQVCSDSIDNNISETFNGYFLAARGNHIIHMLEEIRTSLMVRQVEKYEKMRQCDDRICPTIRNIVERRKEASSQCMVYPALRDKFEVHYLADKFVVSLGDRSCTCRVWNLSGIPCFHALVVIHFMNLDVYDYVHEYYTIGRYLLAYEEGLQPIRGSNMWPEKKRGRPKKARPETIGEATGTSSSVVPTVSEARRSQLRSGVYTAGRGTYAKFKAPRRGRGARKTVVSHDARSEVVQEIGNTQESANT
ncbi:uncharacterized protein LOC131018820 [Salvia miltiorrhiza]|uniref:uncharacterized protein LOC131018820 n=1 Tax=Salvia miltiorrhiza TaxID=226208 RepID=UPI0025ABA41C|nr:uncharacterized protein LOC131018820 [Salvia miltiorrhiza]